MTAHLHSVPSQDAVSRASTNSRYLIAAIASTLIALVLSLTCVALQPGRDNTAHVAAAVSVDAAVVARTAASDLLNAVRRTPGLPSQLDRVTVTVAPDSSLFDDASAPVFEHGPRAPIDPDLVLLSSRSLVRSLLVPRSRPVPSLRS